MIDVHRERDEWHALVDSDHLESFSADALILTIKDLAHRLLLLTQPWGDFEEALWLLDQAEQALVQDYGATADPRALALLEKFHERVEELRLEGMTVRP